MTWHTSDMPDIAMLAQRNGLVVLEPEAIAELPADERVNYLARLRAFCLDHDMREYGPYVEWLKYADRCGHVDDVTGESCTRTRYADRRVCLAHLDITEIDPLLQVKKRADVARLRMAEMLDAGVTQLEEIINADPDNISPNTRLNAITLLFDRAGLPKQTSSTFEGKVEVTETSSYHDVIAARLDRLAASTVQTEIEAIEAEIIEEES